MIVFQRCCHIHGGPDSGAEGRTWGGSLGFGFRFGLGFGWWEVGGVLVMGERLLFGRFCGTLITGMMS